MKQLLFVVLFVSTMLASEINWLHDYKAALKEAKAQSKDVYMLITSDNCKWCRKFEKTTLEDQATINKLKEKYILLHLSRDKDYIPECFNTKRVPRHYFLTDKGENIYTFLGYWDTEDFASFIVEVDKKDKRK